MVIKNHITSVVIILLSLVTLLGLYTHELFEQTLWKPQSYKQLAIVFMGCLLMSLVKVFSSNKTGLLAIACVFISYAIYALGFPPVAANIFILIVAWLVGDWVFDSISLYSNDKTIINDFLKLTLGLGLLVTVVLYSSHWLVNTPFYYSLAGLIIILIRYKQLSNFHLSIALVENKFKSILCDTVLLFSIALNVIVACKPELGVDALTMHLWIASYIVDFQQWHYDVYQGGFALMPIAGDLAFSIAYMLGGEYAARLINLSFILILAGLIYQFITPMVGAFVSKLLLSAYLTLPAIGLISGSLFIEHFWALMIFSPFLLATSGDINFFVKWAFATLLISLAMATKVMTVFFIPVFVIFFFLQLMKVEISRKQLVLFFIGCGFVVFTVAGKTYLYALWKTGNPVFPFMNEVFQSPYMPVNSFVNERFTKDFSYWRLLYDMTFNSKQFMETQNGGFGFLWLIVLPPTLFYIRKKANSLFQLSFVLIIFVTFCIFSQQAYFRYLNPLYPFALILVVGMYCLNDSVIFKRIFSVTICIIIALNVCFFPTTSWRDKHLIYRDFSDEVRRRKPSRVLVDRLNVTEDVTGVLFIGRFYPARLKVKAYGTSWFFPDIQEKLSNEAGFSIGLVDVLDSYNLNYVIVKESVLNDNLALKKSFFEEFKIVETVNKTYLGRRIEHE